jgi:hypothetical protein
MFDTATVINRYEERMKKIWKDEFPLFKRMVCRLSSVEENVQRERLDIIKQTAASGKNACIYLPEKDRPSRSLSDVEKVADTFYRGSAQKRTVYFFLSGGVTTSIGKDGQIEDREKLCGEVDAKRMGIYFREQIGSTAPILRWTGDGVLEENASKHAGHQAIILPPILFANNISLLIMTGPVEQISLRLTLKAAAGIDIFAKSFPKSENVQKWRQNLRIITMPSYTEDGKGWDGMIGRHITAAEDAFAEKRQVSNDHTIGGEMEKTWQEMYEPERIINPCPNMTLAQALRDQLFTYEFAQFL